MHQIAIPSFVDERCIQRRGRVKLFDSIDPARTAHIIVDLQNGFMAPGAVSEIGTAREIVPNVNSISAACREAGAMNVFLQHTIDANAHETWSTWFDYFANSERRKRMDDTFTEGSFGHQLWPKLDITDADMKVKKYRFGAFVDGSSNLHALLQDRGIDTLIITGTATNVCCESTARDAMMMNYKVIFVADGCATFTDAEHNATLTNMRAIFADVLMASEVVGLFSKEPVVQAAE
ncbi:MAG: cysteine hydrolase [Proteobacteria bacterium]|nr:MAG: cysteine hydrolase [Pseudomonadota bacterium]